MAIRQSNYWFRRRPGLGWEPSTWQGWAVIAFFILFVLIALFQLTPASVTKSTAESLVRFFGFLMIALGFLLSAFAFKGPDLHRP